MFSHKRLPNYATKRLQIYAKCLATKGLKIMPQKASNLCHKRLQIYATKGFKIIPHIRLYLIKTLVQKFHHIKLAESRVSGTLVESSMTKFRVDKTTITICSEINLSFKYSKYYSNYMYTCLKFAAAMKLHHYQTGQAWVTRTDTLGNNEIPFGIYCQKMIPLLFFPF